MLSTLVLNVGATGPLLPELNAAEARGSCVSPTSAAKCPCYRCTKGVRSNTQPSAHGVRYTNKLPPGFRDTYCSSQAHTACVSCAAAGPCRLKSRISFPVRASSTSSTCVCVVFPFVRFCTASSSKAVGFAVVEGIFCLVVLCRWRRYSLEVRKRRRLSPRR